MCILMKIWKKVTCGTGNTTVALKGKLPILLT